MTSRALWGGLFFAVRAALTAALYLLFVFVIIFLAIKEAFPMKKGPFRRSLYNMRKTNPSLGPQILYGFSVWLAGDCVMTSDNGSYYIPPPVPSGVTYETEIDAEGSQRRPQSNAA